MPTYQVRDNNYYQPPVGKNWIADRIIAAMQSFSAPRGPEALPTGVSGPPEAGALPRKPAGFFSALGGNDNNRINQAALLRQADVDAGRVPFEAEVGAQKEEQERGFGFKKQQDDEFLKQRREEDKNRREGALERAREGITAARQLNDDRMTASLHEKQIEAARRMVEDARRLRDQKELIRTPRAMSDAEAAQLKRSRWVNMGGSAARDQDTGAIFQLPGQGKPAQTFQLPNLEPLDEQRARWLEMGEKPEEAAYDTATEQMTNIEELLNPTGIPRDISY